MSEEKGQMPRSIFKETCISQKSSEKPQKEQPKSVAQPKTATDTGYASLLSKKIDDFVHEIEDKP